MKKTLVIAAIIAVVALTTAPVFAFTWTDNFEAGVGNWTAAAGCSALGLSTLANATPGGAYSARVGDHAFDKSYHNLGTQLSGTWSTSFNILDDSNYNVYGEMRGYTGNGNYAGNTMVQDIVAGSMSFTAGVAMTGEVYDSTKYQGRYILATGANGWFNLNATRTAGWHTFTITRTNGAVTWYVDGVADRSFTNVTDSGMGVVTIGAAASGTNNSFFDDVKVTTDLTPSVPEPGSLLALGAGLVGMIGMLRRKMA